MQTKNTFKFIASLTVVAVFALVLASSGSDNQNGELKSPTLLPISASVVNSARVGSILPVEPISTITPVIVSTLTPTLQASAVSGLYYVFYVYDYVNNTPSSSPVVSSQYLPATGTKVSFIVPAMANLVDGKTYAWTAKACSDTQGSRCSDLAAYSYFKIQLSAPSLPILRATLSDGSVMSFNGTTWVQVSGPSSISSSLPILRATLSDGSVISFNGTTWVQVSGPSSITSNLPTLNAVLSDGSVVRFDGTKWVQVSAPTTFFGGIGDAIGGFFDAIGDIASGFIGGLIGLFTPNTPTPVLPDIYSIGPDGSVLKFDSTIGPDGDWVVDSPATSSAITFPCDTLSGEPGTTTNPNGGPCNPISSAITFPCDTLSGEPGTTTNPNGGPCEPISSVRTTSEVNFYSSTPGGTVYRFNNTTSQWDTVSTPTVEPVVVPVVQPAPSGIQSIPFVKWVSDIFN